MTDEQKARITLRYGKAQITIGLGLLVGVFWLVSEAMSIRTTVNSLAAERPALHEKLTRIDTAMPDLRDRIARVENRIDALRVPRATGG